MNKKYRVLFMVSRTELTAQGQFVKVKDIQFETESGVQDSIKIPDAVFTKEYAETLLQDKVNEIESIMLLGQ